MGKWCNTIPRASWIGLPFLFLCTCCLINFTHAQQANKYLIYLKDKFNSEYSLEQPKAFLSEKAVQRRNKQSLPITTTDLPPNLSYLAQIRNTGARVLSASRWLNAVLVTADSTAHSKLLQLPCVKGEVANRRKGVLHHRQEKHSQCLVMQQSATDYGGSLSQCAMIGLDQMHAEGIAGQGMTIAVLDAGFYNTDKLVAFDSLRRFERILSTYDFVDREINVYNDLNVHGTQVLSCLAAFLPGKLIGGAYQANYILLRTENASLEQYAEEFTWLMGAEYADSAGADILSSSVGYFDFDGQIRNHSYQEMDGWSTLITKAANHAAATGMVVVNSAGNEGNSSWKYIFAPADSDSILTVGSVNSDGSYSSFSSVGPTADGRIKPDVAAQGANVTVLNADGTIQTNSGTSFSCPLVSSLVAGIWQSKPSLSSKEVIEFIKKSGSQYDAPDNYLGYGIPHYNRLRRLLSTQGRELATVASFHSETNLITLQGKFFFQAEPTQIVDLYGRLVWEGVVLFDQNKAVISALKSLPSGIYFLFFDQLKFQPIKIIK